MSEGPYNLPHGWRWVPLGALCNIIMGQSPPGNTYNTEKNGFPFFQGKADFGKLYPKPRIWCTKPKKIAEAGDILISVRAPVGPTNIANQRCCIGRGLAALRPSYVLERMWLLYHLRAIEKEMAGKGYGSTFSAIKKIELQELLIPLPPLEEQRRIVARIEQLMERVQEVKRLRVAAMKDAERLMQVTLAEVFPRPGSEPPPGWRWVKLGEVCDIVMGQSPPSSTYNSKEQGLPFFQGKADFGDLHPNPRVWCSSPQKIAEPGDILISVRAPVGPTNIADIRCCIGRGLAAIRRGLKIETYWLLFYLRSIKNELEGKGTGSTFTAITKEQLQNLQIPLPSVDEQRRVVAYLNAMQDKVNALKEAQTATEVDFQLLEQAILDKAFRGEL